MVNIYWIDVHRDIIQTNTEAWVIRSIIDVLPNKSSVELSTCDRTHNQTQTLFHMTVGQEDSHWLESLKSFNGSSPTDEVSATSIVNDLFSKLGYEERSQITIFIVTDGTFLRSKTELNVLKRIKTYVVFVSANEVTSPQAKDWGSLATSNKHLFFYRRGKSDFEGIKSLLQHGKFSNGNSMSSTSAVKISCFLMLMILQCWYLVNTGQL